MSDTHAGFTQDPTPAELFAAKLKGARLRQHYSQAKLAAELGYDPSYISKLERGVEPPTREFAERADEVLQEKGTLVQLWSAYSAEREHGNHRPDVATRPGYRVQNEYHAHPTGLIVLHEDARLIFADGLYKTRVRRRLYNGSDVPITQYRIRVAVDRHPNVSQLSNVFYRQRPLTVAELDLTAECEGETMAWTVAHDRDAFKEIWLLFENDGAKYPLNPGDTSTIEYHYSVGAEKWGKWWQRAIRVPTERLSAELIFPRSADPMLWGLQTTLTANRMPVQPAVSRNEEGPHIIYRWAVDHPPLHTRYRFEWRFRNEASEEPAELAPSERMRHLGIAQRGDPILVKPCAPFDLPREADDARATGELLATFLEPLGYLHEFGKGMGLAAPQIGIPRAAAVVRLPGQRPTVLYNPIVVDRSQQQDEKMEGCLSFFDVRGRVPRALAIKVQHHDLRGQTKVSTFQNAEARHWQHEIDHLEGVLYIDRMDDPAADLISVDEYSQAGERWRY